MKTGMREMPARIAVIAVILSSACASSTPSIPPGVNAPRLPAVSSPPRSGPYQWVTTSYGANEALQYDYPHGTESTGMISGLESVGAECSSGKGTFWIVESDKIAEYSYDGKKKLKSLNLSAGEWASCAVSAKDGDVAVTSFTNGVVIFKGGKQRGKEIEDQVLYTYFDGYDAKGDLFVDGLDETGSAALVELSAGSGTFTNVSLPNAIEFPGSVQWDGEYVTVVDQEVEDVYRYAVSKSVAALKGTVALSGAADCAATWIAKPYLFCADAGNDDVEIFKYPAGGQTIATLNGATLPLGIVQVSK